jgi:superfamily II DNA or RNA helicase
MSKVKSTYIGAKGYSILKNELSITEQNKIRTDLMIKPFSPPNSIQKPQEFPVYRESNKKLYVPRFYGIKNYGEPAEILISEGEYINVPFIGSMREYQINIVNTYLQEAKKSGCGLLEIPCGRGKCLGYNTPVLMANGRIKMIQNIRDGDIVMGDDYSEKIVKGVNSGYGKLYRIIQTNGIDYIVNYDHIMTVYNIITNKLEDIPLNILISYSKYILKIYKGVRITKNKEYLFSDIDIEYVYDGDYYGFTIDGNHRFLLGDTTVTHNTVMALNIISEIKKKTLVIVHKEFLMNQWIERIQQFLPSARIGKIQGSIFDIQNKDVVIGMLQSLSMKEYPSGSFDSFGLTISDECFPKGTKVLTERGLINIENLRYFIGKLKVFSYNHVSECYEEMLITNWFERKPRKCFEITYINKNKDIKYILFNKIICSEEHRIYCINKKTYIYAKNIKIGDKVLGLNNEHNIVVNNIECGFQGSLYDIEVEKNHNFFVTGKNNYNEPILVHNCHHISAEVFCRSLFKIVTPYMLGLSATMERKDGLTKVFKMFLGDVIYKEVRDNDDAVLVKTIQYKNDDPEFSETLYNFKGQTHYALMIRKLCEFNNRSELILKILQELLEEDDKRQVMILAHNKSLLKYLYDAIEDRKIASVGYYIGGMKEKALKETETKKVVIATYAMAEEALDIKTLSALILATPKTDVTQAVGRILRVKHENPIVVDIVDQHDVFQKQYIKRRKFYIKCKYKILQTTNNRYLKNNKDWDLMFERTEQKKYKNIINIKDKEKVGHGKCLLDFSKYDNNKII